MRQQKFPKGFILDKILNCSDTKLHNNLFHTGSSGILLIHSGVEKNVSE